MNNEQKQRAIAALTKWWAADSNKAVLSTGYEMAGVLQEMIDAPEPEQPNQSEQHLEIINPPTQNITDLPKLKFTAEFNDGEICEIEVFGTQRNLSRLAARIEYYENLDRPDDLVQRLIDGLPSVPAFYTSESESAAEYTQMQFVEYLEAERDKLKEGNKNG